MLSSYAFVSCLILVSFSAQCGRSLSSEIAGGTCIIGGNGRSLSENDMLVYKDSDNCFLWGEGRQRSILSTFLGSFSYFSLFISVFSTLFLVIRLKERGGGVALGDYAFLYLRLWFCPSFCLFPTFLFDSFY